MRPSSPICFVVLEPAIMTERVTVKVAVRENNATIRNTGLRASSDDRAKESGLDMAP